MYYRRDEYSGKRKERQKIYVQIMDVLLNGLSISVKGELQSLCCMIEKTMSLRCHLLTANGWRFIE